MPDTPKRSRPHANTEHDPRAGDEQPMMAPTPASNGACSPRSTRRRASRGHRRVRHRPHHAAARAGRSHGPRAVPACVDIERAASTPERFHHAVSTASPFTVNGQHAAAALEPAGSARAAFDRTLSLITRARAGAERRPPSCSTRSSSCARSKASQACATYCARCCTRWPKAATASC